MTVFELFRYILGTGKEPYKHQEELWKDLEGLGKEGRIIFLKAPTASGKTEAAVLPFISASYSDWGLGARLIYVLPNHSLIHSQSERINGWLRQLGSNLDVVVDHGSTGAIKPMLHGDIVLTTLDAFIYGYAALRTFHRRLNFPSGNIATSMLVFDEVQMYQDEAEYTPWLLSKMLSFLASTRIPIVVMTATMPELLEKRIKSEIKNGNVKEIAGEKPRRGKVKVYLSLNEHIGNFIDRCLSQKGRIDLRKVIERGEKALIVCNTVSKAKLIVDNIRRAIPANHVLLLHSRFTVNDRRKREEMIKNSQIIVATQIVEAGLDLEKVKYMITEVAPVDALLQRIGRVARRREEEGQAYILGLEDPSPYPSDLIKSTEEAIDEKRLEESLTDISTSQALVNKVYTKYLEEVREKRLKESVERAKGNERKVKELMKRIDDFLPALNEDAINATIYFKELSLFSQPPEVELKVRPERYITLILPSRDLVALVQEKLKHSESYEINSYMLPAILDDVSLNIPIRLVVRYEDDKRQLSNALLKVGDKAVELFYDRGRERSRGSWKVKIASEEDVRSYHTYLMNPSFYEEDGLVNLWK
ncbi:MAG: CRISPR-associated helicase Cas3' [Nitrososphaerales archaeon]